MDAAPRVTVVIPNWNGLQHLPDCLAALMGQQFSGFETILVDNASEDGSVEWAQEYHPGVRVLRRPDNGGFSKAVNAGILASGAEYVALLNNDTLVDPGWLGALVDALDQHPEYDLAASKMILFHDPEKLNAAGDVFVLARMVADNRGFGEPVSRYTQMERVLGACAGAALYRRCLFDAVGLFDEDFFLISEDTDFNLRCLIAGKRCLYVPNARVLHKHGASLKKKPALEIQQLAIRNEAFFAGKNLPLSLLAFRQFVWVCRMLRQTVPLRPGKWRRFPRLLRELPGKSSAEVRGLRMGLAKRRDVWRLKAISTREVVRWLRKGSGPI